jgi:sec-independent protein translocase protein TatA
MSTLLFLNLGAPEILLIALLVLLLFGGKKIPELMKGLGKGVKSFKEGMNEAQDSIKKELDDPVEKKEEKEDKDEKGKA